MGMLSELARLAPKPAPKPKAKKQEPTLVVVESLEAEIKEALETGNYAEVDIGLNNPQPEVEEVVESNDDVDPVVLALLEEILEISETQKPLQKAITITKLVALLDELKSTEEEK